MQISAAAFSIVIMVICWLALWRAMLRDWCAEKVIKRKRHVVLKCRNAEKSVSARVQACQGDTVFMPLCSDQKGDRNSGRVDNIVTTV
jgi:hypothetical protein